MKLKDRGREGKVAFLDIMNGLRQCFVNGPNFTDIEILASWYRFLRELDEESLKRAARKSVICSAFFPSIHTLLALANSENGDVLNHNDEEKDQMSEN